MIGDVNRLLVKADNLCDYIPFVSTVSNLTDIFLKRVFLPSLINKGVAHNHYYTHLQRKSILRSIVLCIPVIGNLFIALYDLKNKEISRKELFCNTLNSPNFSLKNGSPEFIDDKDVVLAFVRKDGNQLSEASERLKNDPDVVTAAFIQAPFSLHHASDALRNNKEFILTLAKIHPIYAVFGASIALKSNQEFINLVSTQVLV